MLSPAARPRRRALPDSTVVVTNAPCEVLVDRESLEQALVHLVQRDRGKAHGFLVFLDLRVEDARAIVEIIDLGSA